MLPAVSIYCPLLFIDKIDFKHHRHLEALVVCGVWCVVCGGCVCVWCVVCGVCVCGVWCVVCGVWCVVCGVCDVRVFV